jgi:DNA polymerase-3 subunit gamma/tau
VRQAAIDVVGADWAVETIVDPGAQAETSPSAAETAADPGAEPDPAPRATPPTASEPPAAVREAIQPTRPAGEEPPSAPPTTLEAAGVDPDDAEVDTDGLAGAELLEQALGARVIEEIPHQ